MSKTTFFILAILTSCLLTISLIGATVYFFQDELLSHLRSEQEKISSAEVSTQLQEYTLAIPDIIAEANKAVVSVVVTKDIPIYEQYYEEFNPFGFFGGFFSVPKVREKGSEEREVGGGSGFIVSRDGLVVTNRHVVSDEEARYSVILLDGQSYEASILARDTVLDIAVLQIENLDGKELPTLTFGDSTNLRLGETVIVIGNALAEFRNSVSTGIISGLARSITASDNSGVSERLSQVIQTDAAINPGNSGGPLLNSKGEVIGVSVATTVGADNISFAIPSAAVSSIVASIEEYGEIRRPYLGVRYTMVTPKMKELNNLNVDYGAIISRGETPDELAVIPGSPADKAGLVENDIILKIDGEELRNKDLATILRSKKINQVIELLILKRGEEKTISVTLEKAP